jgi:hypothetical protein
MTDLKKENGAADRTSDADPDITEHNKTPVHAFAASTGVISPEYGQAVSPFRGGKLHCLPSTYSNSGRHTTKNSIIDEFFFRPPRGFIGDAGMIMEI